MDVPITFYAQPEDIISIWPLFHRDGYVAAFRIVRGHEDVVRYGIVENEDLVGIIFKS